MARRLAGLCYRRRRVPDDERKGRRLGDETKGRIADLASGWTVDSDAPPVPEPPIRREPSGPNRTLDAPRRKAKTQPPPPPGSAARKALEDKIVELRAVAEADVAQPPVLPGRPPPPVPPRGARGATGAAPTAGRKRAARTAEPIDPAALPEADRTKENRGAVGIKHDKSASLTTNAASGTIGGDTPAPIFDRAAIAAGQRGAAGPRPAVRHVAGADDLDDLDDPDDPDDDPLAALVDDLAEQAGAEARARGTPPGRLGSPPGDAVPRSAADRVSAAASRPTAAGSGPGDAVPQRAADRVSAGASRPVGSGSGPRDAIPQRAADRASSGAARPTAASGPAAIAAPRADSIEDGAPALPAPPAAGEARLAVPVGEFDQAVTILDQDKRRIAHAQATIKRDAAGALLGLAEPAPARMPAAEVLFDEPLPRRADSSFDEPTRRRGDETGFDEQTRRRADGFDEQTRRREPNDSSAAATGEFGRGDPTGGDDATAIAVPGARTTASGTLRSSAALPRRRGAAGDLRYIATVIIGLRRARRELAEVTARQTTRQQSRRHHLVTLGRAAVTTEGFEHGALEAARDKLAGIEDERSQHAGHVVAADAELIRVRREREARAKQHATDVAALDAEIAGLGKKLEPLHRQAAAARKRGTDLHDALRRIDARIAATEATLDAPGPAKRDRAEVQAEIATLRADRKAIQSDEPVIAGQLDTLDPQIAALEAARGEAQRKRAEADAAEHDDQRRVEELLAAIGAKRKVVDRAAADAEARRDKILFQLGERLHVDRPDDLAAELAPVDAIDLELGSADRRLMELREILTSVDRWKLARGIALLVLVLAALAGIAVGLWYLGWI